MKNLIILISCSFLISACVPVSGGYGETQEARDIRKAEKNLSDEEKAARKAERKAIENAKIEAGLEKVRAKVAASKAHYAKKKQQKNAERMAQHRKALSQNYGSVRCDSIDAVASDKSYSAEDKKLIKSYLTQHGFNQRDVDLLSNEWGTFSTGMSGMGMKCLGYKIVNDAFYSGVGHRWQMQKTGDTRYVYLKGNGTNKGMIVDSWN